MGIIEVIVFLTGEELQRLVVWGAGTASLGRLRAGWVLILGLADRHFEF